MANARTKAITDAHKRDMDAVLNRVAGLERMYGLLLFEQALLRRELMRSSMGEVSTGDENSSESWVDTSASGPIF